MAKHKVAVHVQNIWYLALPEFERRTKKVFTMVLHKVFGVFDEYAKVNKRC